MQNRAVNQCQNDLTRENSRGNPQERLPKIKSKEKSEGLSRNEGGTNRDIEREGEKKHGSDI
jgi:hypothetical protein